MASKGKGGKGKGGKAGADELTAQDEKEMYAAKVWTLQGRLGSLKWPEIEQKKANSACKSENELREKVKAMAAMLEEEKKKLFNITWAIDKPEQKWLINTNKSRRL